MGGSSSWADEAEREEAERKKRSVEEKKKVNPFGDAKPREVVLAEKGVDWRKKDMELQHRSVSRPESHEEKKLKEEIRVLEEAVQNTVGNDCGWDGQGADADHMDRLEAQLAQKEKELQGLTLTLDDKIRFPKRPVERSPSCSGHLGSDTGPDLRKQSSRLEHLDATRGYGPETPGPMSGRGGMLAMGDGEWLSGVSLRTRDFTRGLERETQGSFCRHGNMTRSQSSRNHNHLDGRKFSFGKQGSHFEHGELARRCDADRPGFRSGNGDNFQGNGSERSGSHSGHLDVIRRNDSEKMGSCFGSSDQGYNCESLGSGSWHGDVQRWVSGRQGYSSGGNGNDSNRWGSQSEQGSDFRGYDFEGSGICGGYDEVPKNNGHERPGSRAGHRGFSRPCDAECPGSQYGPVEAERDEAFDERFYLSSCKTGRSTSIFDSGRLGPLPGQADSGRGHMPYRGSVGRASRQEQDSSRREDIVMQQYDRRGRQYNEMQQDNRRGKGYGRTQRYVRRQTSFQQNK